MRELTALGSRTSAFVAPLGYLLNPDVDKLKVALSHVREEGSVLIIYYVGHGEKPDQDQYFVLTRSRVGKDLDCRIQRCPPSRSWSG